MTLKLNFTSPFPHSQRDNIIKCFRGLGLSYERIFQDGPYSYHKFFGRLPTVDSCSDVDVHIINNAPIEHYDTLKNVDFIEIYLFIERE